MEESVTDIDQGNAKFGGQEATVIFDRVFVPYDHVFMNGEVEFASELWVSPNCLSFSVVVSHGVYLDTVVLVSSRRHCCL